MQHNAAVSKGIPPAWAQDLVLTVAVQEGLTALPELVWRQRTVPRSTGVTQVDRGRIIIRSGSDIRGQRLALLHELAHWVIAADGYCTESHGIRFYEKVWDFYLRFGVPVGYALVNETRYRKRALWVAFRRDLPGAHALARVLVDAPSCLAPPPADSSLFDYLEVDED